jgi:hypothetical protein
LPEPVSARPRTSWPARASGRVRAWIGRGVVMPRGQIAPDRSASVWCRGLAPRGSPRRCPPRGRGRGGGRRRPRRAAHDVESAQAGGLLQLFGQVVEQAGGRNRRLSRQPFDQAVHHHVGEPFDLRIDDRNRLVGQHPGCATETGHARINSSRRLALAHRNVWVLARSSCRSCRKTSSGVEVGADQPDDPATSSWGGHRTADGGGAATGWRPPARWWPGGPSGPG